MEADAGILLALTAEEEALLADALPSAPEEFDAPPATPRHEEIDLFALQREDEEIRRRTELAMASLGNERAELRALIADADGGENSAEAEADDAGRAARQREMDKQLAALTADLAAWQPDLDELCDPVSHLDDGAAGTAADVPFFLTAGAEEDAVVNK